MSEHESRSPEQPTDRDKVEGLGRDRIKGVFSTQTVEKVGTGTTQRKSIQKTYWYCEEAQKGVVQVQPLNKNYVPSGPKRDVPVDEIIAKFNPEPEFYVQTVYPKMQELEKTIQRGEDHREAGRAYSAELEFKEATNVDEENVRANFGLGLTYLDRGDAVKANDIFERLVNLDAAFSQEHKHLFNDFGINLRKNKMLDQALEYYRRAEQLETHDENLMHNMARVFFEMGELERCVEYLKRALELQPDMEEATKFLEYLKKQGYLTVAEDGTETLNDNPDGIASGQSKASGATVDVDGGVQF